MLRRRGGENAGSRLLDAPDREAVFCQWDAEKHGIEIRMKSIYHRSGYVCTAYGKTNYADCGRGCRESDGSGVCANRDVI